MMCMRCWRDAYDGGHYGGCETQTERYGQLLDERGPDGCTPEQQAGEWWDAERGVDTRVDEARRARSGGVG